ncbi:hypothetical protein IL306_006374 [Fusarium sp. DS 682]|nr:hypothetical protein IL306_006374 [Fusarium sp. DS 682]
MPSTGWHQDHLGLSCRQADIDHVRTYRLTPHCPYKYRELLYASLYLDKNFYAPEFWDKITSKVTTLVNRTIRRFVDSGDIRCIPNQGNTWYQWVEDEYLAVPMTLQGKKQPRGVPPPKQTRGEDVGRKQSIHGCTIDASGNGVNAIASNEGNINIHQITRVFHIAKGNASNLVRKYEKQEEKDGDDKDDDDQDDDISHHVNADDGDEDIEDQDVAMPDAPPLIKRKPNVPQPLRSISPVASSTTRPLIPLVTAKKAPQTPILRRTPPSSLSISR